MILHLLFLQKILRGWFNCRVLQAQLLWGILCAHSLVRSSHVSLWGASDNVGCEWSMRHMQLELRILYPVSLIHYRHHWGLRILHPPHLRVKKRARPLWERRLDEGSLLGRIPHVRLLGKMDGKSWYYLHGLSRVHRDIFGFGVEGENTVFPSGPGPLFTLRKTDSSVIVLYYQCSDE